MSEEALADRLAGELGDGVPAAELLSWVVLRISELMKELLGSKELADCEAEALGEAVSYAEVLS